VKEALARIVTALVGATVVIFATVYGGVWFVGLLAIVALLGQLEIYRLLREAEWSPYTALGLTLGLILLLRPYFAFWLEASVVVVCVLLSQMVFRTGDRHPLVNLGATVLGVAYPTLLLSLIADVRLARGLALAEPAAFKVTLLILFLVWAGDIFALYVGSTLGKHPLLSRVSPKKTWEGYAGGLVAAIVVGIVFAVTQRGVLPPVDVAALVFICGVVAPIGDLAESRMKRSVSVKDSGGLLPGHGGILDRIDTLLVGGALSWAYLMFRFPV
jgi:phosphatidate cytidylyltransferase